MRAHGACRAADGYFHSVAVNQYKFTGSVGKERFGNALDCRARVFVVEVGFAVVIAVPLDIYLHGVDYEGYFAALFYYVVGVVLCRGCRVSSRVHSQTRNFETGVGIRHVGNGGVFFTVVSPVPFAR